MTKPFPSADVMLVIDGGECSGLRRAIFFHLNKIYRFSASDYEESWLWSSGYNAKRLSVPNIFKFLNHGLHWVMGNFLKANYEWERVVRRHTAAESPICWWDCSYGDGEETAKEPSETMPESGDENARIIEELSAGEWL
jgi:hypothetical protein